MDCTDNYRLRDLINDAAVLLGKPVVFGAVYQFEGQESVFDAKRGPCFRCQYPSPPPAGLVPTCASSGVISPLPGIIGSIQAKADFGEKVKRSSKLVIVDFYSESCIPCKRMSPVLSELEEQYHGAVFVAKVNAAYEKELVDEYAVRSAPTLVFFKNGDVAERILGAIKKDELEQLIEPNL